MKKVVIVGVSASGKSVFGRALAKRTGLPLTHMDTIWWKAGWVETSEEEATKRLEELTASGEWIIEGYIPKDARPFVFERADIIIHLDYSGSTAAWRYLKRWWKHRKNARPELEGSPEKFSFKFLKLVWSKGEAISLKAFLREVKSQQKIITFTAPSQAEGFLRGL